MRKLRPYKDDSFEFYQVVVSTKKNSIKDANYTERLEDIEEVIEEKFGEYDEGFAQKSLESLDSNGFVDPYKSDLFRLYNYSSPIIQTLKVNVTTIERNRRLNTCQNCTISEVSSFDHFVNKEEFPEFSIHPKNLFPSCTKCNSYKGQRWRENGRLKFLNLYQDELPVEQYLFVEIEVFDNDVIRPRFYLDNVNGIDAELFQRIEGHYKSLHLFERFSENADTVITSLEDSIRMGISQLSFENVVDMVVECCEREMEHLGFNYWKSILSLALIRNQYFTQMIVE